MLMTLEERRRMAKRWEDGDLVAGEPKRLSKMASVYAKRACAALDEGLHPRKRVRLGERGSFKWVSVGVQSGCAKASKFASGGGGGGAAEGAAHDSHTESQVQDQAKVQTASAVC